MNKLMALILFLAFTLGVYADVVVSSYTGTVESSVTYSTVGSNGEFKRDSAVAIMGIAAAPIAFGEPVTINAGTGESIIMVSKAEANENIVLGVAMTSADTDEAVVIGIRGYMQVLLDATTALAPGDWITVDGTAARASKTTFTTEVSEVASFIGFNVVDGTYDTDEAFVIYRP